MVDLGWLTLCLIITFLLVSVFISMGPGAAVLVVMGGCCGVAAVEKGKWDRQ